MAFFTAGTRHLLEAGQRAGVRHHVALSIVGVDRVDYGYYEGKRAQERLVLDGQVPGSVLRATQFHEFAGQILTRSRGPFALMPRVRTQPVAAREVAAALAELAAGSVAGLAPELACPEEHGLVDMARPLLRATGQRRRVVPVRLPGCGRPADGRRRAAAGRPWTPGNRDVRPVAASRDGRGMSASGHDSPSSAAVRGAGSGRSAT